MALGVNGPAVREHTIPLLERFVKWRSVKPYHYLPKTGLEAMPTASEISKKLERIKNMSSFRLAFNKFAFNWGIPACVRV